MATGELVTRAIKVVEERRHPVQVTLTAAELELLCEALDSHVYWQLSGEMYRHNGHVSEPGSSDPEMQAEIQKARQLLEKLGGCADWLERL